MGDAGALHEIAIAAARVGGQVAAEGFGRHFEVNRKADKSEVTEYDLAAERAVIDYLRSVRPDDVFLGEEATDNTYKSAGDRLCWVIDPIDGTRNFTRSSPNFACSIGVLQHGAAVAGAIFQPLADMCWSAYLGGGAYSNGVRIELDLTPEEAGDRKLVVGIPSARHKNSAAWVSRILDAHVVRNVGSAALHIAMVATGQLDALLLNNCKLWDVAGGALLLTETGATFTDLNGNPRLPIDLATYDGALTPTLAGTPGAHDVLMALRDS